MLNASALILIFTTALGLFVLSLMLARRDTLDELRNVFDWRVIRRAMRSAHQFGIGTMLWFTMFVATAIALVLCDGGSVGDFFAILMLLVGSLLARVALAGLFEPEVRRFDSPSNTCDLSEFGDVLPKIQLGDNAHSSTVAEQTPISISIEVDASGRGG